MLKPQRLSLAKVGSSGGVASKSAYALWEYRSGSWVVKRPAGAEGFQAGSPPAQKGRFEGEIVRKYCEPVLGPASAPPAGP